MSEPHSILLEVEALCCQLVEEGIDEPKLRRLERLVLENPEAKRTYIEYINLHAALGHYAAGELTPDVRLPNISEDDAVGKNKKDITASPLPLSEIKLPLPGLPGLNAYWVPLTGVLVVLGLAGAWIFEEWKNLDKAETAQVVKVQTPETLAPTASGEEKQNAEYVAELTWLGAADEKGGNADSPKNSLLAKGGVLRIQDEDVHVRFACGAEVTLHGPAVFHIQSEKLARLEHGTLEAKVPPQAIGFLIDTPASRVIDLGTEFEVTVTDHGDTHITVLNGEVEAEPMRPWLTGGELRRKLFEGDSLRLSPPVTESFRVDFDAPNALEVFDIVRHDPATCLLDPAAGLLTLNTQKGSICGESNNNSNILVAPIPNCDFDAVLKVKRFKPTQHANHLSLATLDDQDNVYRVSYWLDGKEGKRGFVCTKEENARHSFIRDANGIQDHLFDMEDRPFRLRIVRKGSTISTYWGEETGPWFSSGKTPYESKPRFVGFFAAEGSVKRSAERIDCVIDSFELNLSPPEPQDK